jgi:hypothetical protein
MVDVELERLQLEKSTHFVDHSLNVGVGEVAAAARRIA